jgi:chromosome segregation ATPase
MKKTWVSILNLVGITASDDSSEKIQLQEEELNAIKAKLEGMTGAEAEKAAALADVAAKTEALAQAQAEHAAAVAAKDARIAELENEVKTLGAKPGDEPTNTQTDSNNDVKGAGDLGLPAYANTDLPIYKELAAMQNRFK